MDGRAGRSIWIYRHDRNLWSGALPRDCGGWTNGGSVPIGGLVLLALRVPGRPCCLQLLRARWMRGDMPSGDASAGSRRFGLFRFVAYFDTPCSGCRDIQSAKPSGGIHYWQVPWE